MQENHTYNILTPYRTLIGLYSQIWKKEHQQNPMLIPEKQASLN